MPIGLATGAGVGLAQPGEHLALRHPGAQVGPLRGVAAGDDLAGLAPFVARTSAPAARASAGAARTVPVVLPGRTDSGGGSSEKLRSSRPAGQGAS